ncbi:MAG: HAMP domain-containing histidine kinase [Clostridia bacterium]|jgi:signal transduction histidine kinase|nr:HAMP domain-containing histidine kinase [Clostridia bacterium]
MIVIIIILTLIIIGLITYFLLLNKELKRLPKEIELLKNINTNNLIHSQYNLKNINPIILKINDLLKETNKIELEFNNKNESMLKMITNISHDLRTPLTSAIGYINMILYADINEKEKINELKIVEKRLKRLDELINSFFEFSKIMSNTKKLELTKINLNAVLENCIANYYEDYKKQDREIKLSYCQNKIILFSNEELLTRILDNLIANAYKHSKSDLHIKVANENNVKMTFINELLYEELDTKRMFEEFYTIDISRTSGNTGLGLAIVKEFTEQLDGRIYALKRDKNLEIVIEF